MNLNVTKTEPLTSGKQKPSAVKAILRPFLILLFCACSVIAVAQPGGGKVMQIAEIEVVGNRYTDGGAIKVLSGLEPGMQIREGGNEVAKAIRRFWKQQLFADVTIEKVKEAQGMVFLRITVKELPRLMNVLVEGLNSGEKRDLEETLLHYQAEVLNRNLINKLTLRVKNELDERGFCEATLVTDTVPAPLPNRVDLIVRVHRGPRCKIENVTWSGNEKLSDHAVQKALKPVMPRSLRRPTASSRYAEYRADEGRESLLAAYHRAGYQDVTIKVETMSWDEAARKVVHYTIDEGQVYYLRSVRWIGNHIFTDGQLDSILNMPPGTVFDRARFEQGMFFHPQGLDVSSFYLNRGHLFFRLDPVQLSVDGDQIDYEVRITEGARATISKVTFSGNTRTNQHVLLREVRTQPGMMFRRVDIMRSQRDLAQLGYLDPMKFDVRTYPDPKEGTVHIEYVVGEAVNDRFELSGGWGNGAVVGSLGFVFNNFSAQNALKFKEYKPIPAGDGQTLSLRAQSAGKDYYSFNFSFAEPWLGGKKANYLGLSAYYSYRQANAGETLDLYGASATFGKRLKWPDDYTTLSATVGAQRYLLNNYSLFSLTDGAINNYFIGATIRRNTTDNPNFPSKGTDFKIETKIAPPWSFLGPDKQWEDLPAEDRFSTLEYHKWKVSLKWYSPLQRKKNPDFVLATKAGFGFLGAFNKEIGLSPFDRFYMGGSGMNLNALEPRELIGLRGYPEAGLSNTDGDVAAMKYGIELRYRLSKSPQFMVYVLGFAEAGNTWSDLRNVDPFNLKRSAGLGIRIQTPMFGTIGFDYGWGFDDLGGGSIHKAGQGNPTFTLGFDIGDF